MLFRFSSGESQSCSALGPKSEGGELACEIREKEEILVSMKFTTQKGSVALPWAINKDSAWTCIGR